MSVLEEGRRDLARRAELATIAYKRWRLRRALAGAEAELGVLGWEQVEYYDETVTAEVERVRAFELAEVDLLNQAAELSARRGALEREQAAIDAARAAELARMAEARRPLDEKIAAAEARRTLRAQALERFRDALAELEPRERDLRARQDAIQRDAAHGIAAQVAAGDARNALERLAAQRRLLDADRATAAAEVEALDAKLGDLRARLGALEAEAAATERAHGESAARLAGEMRKIDQERKESAHRVSRLDRGKRRSYRIIGATLADAGIAPLNQPEALARVTELRAGDLALTDRAALLRSATGDPASVLGFYVIGASLLCALLLLLLALAK